MVHVKIPPLPPLYHLVLQFQITEIINYILFSIFVYFKKYLAFDMRILHKKRRGKNDGKEA